MGCPWFNPTSNQMRVWSAVIIHLKSPLVESILFRTVFFHAVYHWTKADMMYNLGLYPRSLKIRMLAFRSRSIESRLYGSVGDGH